AYRAAGFDAFAMPRAFRHIDLVAVVDGLLRTGVDTGVTARTELEIDRVARLPLQFEGAQIAGQRLHLARPDRVAALHRQFGTFGVGQQHADIELCRELFGPG